MQSFHLIIVAGGSGTRMGGDLPKQYRSLNGLSSLERSVRTCLQAGSWERVLVVIHPDHRLLANTALNAYPIVEIITGGDTRSASVGAALAALEGEADDACVIIHDAARPFVAPQSVTDVLSAMNNGERSVTLGIPITDTLCRTNGVRVDRDNLMALQTPQGFHLGSLRAAYAAHPEGDTDETAILQRIGIAPFFVPGHPDNIKITTPVDWSRAEQMTHPLQHAAREFRTGHGYDIHAFAEGFDRPLMLAGVSIPHTKSLRAHSDGDVVLHALADALYGTMGLGDIGTHFPPSDPAWQDADSAQFIRHALDHLGQRGGTLHHVDLTIICEEPKINPYRAQMQSRLRDLTTLSLDRIAIKATTTEGLGAIGRHEGIAVHALVSVSFPC